MVTGPTVVLIGPPGAGKSTVGRALAGQTGQPFADTDLLIQEREGREIADIFVEDGEQYFRTVEREVVTQALAEREGVLALGGGAVLDPVTRGALEGRYVVYLEVDLREAVRRTGLDHGRPLLALNPRNAWLRLMEERREIYESLAALRVDTSRRTPDELVEEIVAGLAGTSGSVTQG